MFDVIYKGIGPAGVFTFVCLVAIGLTQYFKRPDTTTALPDPTSAKPDTPVPHYPRVDLFIDILSDVTPEQEYQLVSRKVTERFFSQKELVELFIRMAHTDTLTKTHGCVLRGLGRCTLTDEEKNRIHAAYKNVLCVEDLDELVDFLATTKMLTKQS